MVVCSIRYEDAEGSVFDSRFCRLEGQKKAAMMASGPRCWVLCLVFVGGGVVGSLSRFCRGWGGGI